MLILFLFGLYKEALCFIMFILSLCSNMLLWKAYLNTLRQKLKKHAPFKTSSREEMFTRLFLFFSSRDEIASPSFWLSFWQGSVHSRMNISFRQKRVNSKRHFTRDRDDFIPERVSSQDEISRVNTLLGCRCDGKNLMKS